MENLFIKGESGVFFVPHVDFNAETGVCELSGESYLEDTRDFYSKILAWLDEYMTEKKAALEFNFKLTYFNTSSSKSILDVFKKLKAYKDEGGNVTINWHYPEDDEDIVEEAEDYMADVGLDFNMKPY